MTVNRLKKKCKMVPVYIAEDVLSGKKHPRSVGRMSDPDASGPVILDREAWNWLVAGRKKDRETTVFKSHQGGNANARTIRR